MIFYTLQRWMKSWIKLTVWMKSKPLALEESLEGRVDAEIEKGKVWRVRHLATFWMARSDASINFKSGDYIKVVKRRGLILFIEPSEPNE